MLDDQKAAVQAVRDYAQAEDEAHRAYLERVCAPFQIDIHALIERVLTRPVTINFHPDRLSNNGETVMKNLIKQGEYRGQFQTGTSNGGTTAYIGGERFQWEQRLFFGTYPADSIKRPKYGALNLCRYHDGASARFGSCFFVLNHQIVDRCTFAYGDSSSHPTALCTSDTFAGILVKLFEDIHQNGRLLNKAVSSDQEALAILLSPSDHLKDMGKNLDYCIEAHIHGDISLAEDVDYLYMDESFQRTSFADDAALLCETYGIGLNWIPKRQVPTREIGELFRGPMIPQLAQRIDQLFCDGAGFIDAALIGQGSRDSMTHFSAWSDLGNEAELFQYFKQLWHTVAYFG